MPNSLQGPAHHPLDREDHRSQHAHHEQHRSGHRARDVVGPHDGQGLGHDLDEDDDQQRHHAGGDGDAPGARHHARDELRRQGGRQDVEHVVADQHGADHRLLIVEQAIDPPRAAITVALQLVHAAPAGAGQRRFRRREHRRHRQQREDQQAEDSRSRRSRDSAFRDEEIAQTRFVDVALDEGVADGAGQDQGDAAVARLLVLSHVGEKGGGGERFRTHRRERRRQSGARRSPRGRAASSFARKGRGPRKSGRQGAQPRPTASPCFRRRRNPFRLRRHGRRCGRG